MRIIASKLILHTHNAKINKLYEKELPKSITQINHTNWT